MNAINVPTLILHGVNDEVCPFSLALAQRDMIRNSKLVAIENCGHFLFYDQMDRFNKELVDFVES